MLTPYFQLNQTEDKLFVIVHAPYSNIADCEIYVDKDDFRFYSSPYYLRLHLPGNVVNSDEPPVQYDADNGQFNVELIKSVPGEHFKDLDLIAKFLSPQKNQRVNVKPDIQVLNCTKTDNVDDSSDDTTDSSDEWLINQETPSLPPKSSNDDLSKTKYGFANQVQDVFRIVKDEFREVFDIINVEETTNIDRKKLREKAEDEQFNDDHYLFDFMEPSSELQEALMYEVDYSVEAILTDEERIKLKNFGNKEYLLTKEDRWVAYLSLIDILFGYAYDQRTTLGESTVESPWTINKLSATLSWVQSFSNVKEVALCCVRRSLCYPLYRYWTLSMKVLDDTISILKSGNRQVLHCLLKIHELFNSSESRYILNQLYITDYCIWLQADNVNSKLRKFSDLLLEVKKNLSKSEIGFHIDILEAAAYLTIEDDLPHDLHKINIKNDDKSNQSSSSSSSSLECEDEDGSSESEDSKSETELDSDDDPPDNSKGS